MSWEPAIAAAALGHEFTTAEVSRTDPMGEDAVTADEQFWVTATQTDDGWTITEVMTHIPHAPLTRLARCEVDEVGDDRYRIVRAQPVDSSTPSDMAGPWQQLDSGLDGE